MTEPPTAPPSAQIAPEPSRPPADAAALPAPAGRRLKTLGWVGSTYFGEGLPWSFIHQMVTQYLTAIRAPLEQVSWTSYFHLAVTLKFLWSPVVELRGTKRGWMIGLQVVLGLGMIGIAVVSTLGSLPLLWVALVPLAILHATHDVACDGFFMHGLDRNRQALYSGVRVAAFRAAMSVGGALLVVLAARTSWFAGFATAGTLMLIVALVSTALAPHPERPADGAAIAVARPATPRTPVLEIYRSFFAQPQALLVLSFMFTYKMGDVMMFNMSQPMLRDIGVDTATRGYVSLAGMWTQIGAALVGGWLISRLGFERCLIPLTYVQNLAIPLYVVLAVAHPGLPVIVAIVMVEQIASGMGNAAQVVFLLRRCRSRFSAAHYAMATAVVSLATTVAGARAGEIASFTGYPVFFCLAFAASIPSLILVLFVPRGETAAPAPAAA